MRLRQRGRRGRLTAACIASAAGACLAGTSGAQWGIRSPRPATPSPSSSPSPLTGDPAPAVPPAPAAPPAAQAPQGGYSQGTILPTHAQASELDAAVDAAYRAWKGKFLTQAGCDPSMWYVNSRGDTSVDALTVSEAHGYGMVILASMGARDPDAQARFDGMVRLWRASPAQSGAGLMAWNVAPNCRPPPSTGAATDGDLDIAYALLIAQQVWGAKAGMDYGAAAKEAMGAILGREVDGRRGSILALYDNVGPADPHLDASRTSDAAMLGHFRAFAAASGDAAWSQVLSSATNLLERLQSTASPKAGLFPDFAVQASSASPRPAPPMFLESANDGNYYYNACRVPMRLALDVLTHDSPRARAMVNRVNAFVRTQAKGDPTAIGNGYALDGTPLGQGAPPAFVAPLAVAAMCDPDNVPWLDALWRQVTAKPLDQLNYYHANVSMLAIIALTGHWQRLPG